MSKRSTAASGTVWRSRPTRSSRASPPSRSWPSTSIRDWRGPHLVFVAYAGAGVGALDVSNSDAVAGQDPTNPVTFAFGTNYAFPRTIVSMNDDRQFTYTPTINYGGNNGRAALLGSNGLYYSVGNANNGNAATFGPSNGTNPDVTETTGLEVVNPINARHGRRGDPGRQLGTGRSADAVRSSAPSPTSPARTTTTAA